MDESRIYEGLGKYIVFFQLLENELKLIGWHLRTPDDPSASKAYFSSTSFKTIVMKLRSLFSQYVKERDIVDKEIYVDRFNEMAVSRF